MEIPLLDPLQQKKHKKKTRAKSAFDIFRSERKDLMSQFKCDALELYPEDASAQQGHINAAMKRELKKEQDRYEELARKANGQCSIASKNPRRLMCNITQGWYLPEAAHPYYSTSFFRATSHAQLT